MTRRIILKSAFYYLSLILTVQLYAHPTGNMISVGNTVLWSYIDPIDDASHHACVMIWSEGSQPKVLIKSEFPASDYMLYGQENYVYLLERRFIQSKDIYECRILKMKMGEDPVVLWGWFKDEWRVGEGGFFMTTDDQIVFARYPEVYCLDKGKKPVKYPIESPQPISGLRAVENNQILLMAENTCWLIDQKGKILETWDGLLEESVDNAPLNRNQIFDIAYHQGELLLAYWGKRTFESISNNGDRKTILQLEAPYTPHWVAYHGNKKLLFSSKLLFDGSTPKPNLMLSKLNGEMVKVWSE